jgi:hypothetical protein
VVRVLWRIAAVSSLVGVASCLQDLPGPIDCPPAGAVEGRVEECVTALSAWFQTHDPDLENSCLDQPDYLGCYRGERDCACGSGECPVAEDACYPPGDCPPAVRERFPSAECMRLSPDDVGPELSEPEQCLCGCEECITVCDGKGPVWAQIELANLAGDGVVDPKGFLLLSISRLMPASGRLGVYMRARGRSYEFSEVQAGDSYLVSYPQEQLGIGDPRLIESLPRDMNDRFEELVLPQRTEYAWTSNDDRPGSIVIGSAVNAFTVLEIDCVVPFVY